MLKFLINKKTKNLMSNIKGYEYVMFYDEAEFRKETIFLSSSNEEKIVYLFSFAPLLILILLLEQAKNANK